MLIKEIKDSYLRLILLMVCKEKEQMKSKGLGSARVFNRHVNNITQEISHLDKTKTKKNQTLVDASASNASLAMDSFQIIDDLKAQNERLQQQNDEYRSINILSTIILPIQCVMSRSIAIIIQTYKVV